MSQPLKRFALRTQGSLNFEPSDPPRPPGRYVYQTVRAGLGNVSFDKTARTQLRRHVIPFDPQTASQLARRAAFAAAVLAWQQLDAADQTAWTRAARPHRLPGYNYFLRKTLEE